MGVIISVIGADQESDEYRAAVKLKKIMDEGLPNNVIGEVTLFTNATLIGHEVKDIDLFMIGKLQNYKPVVEFFDAEGEFLKERVDISSFCTTIEVKSHDINGIFRNGTDFYVKYGLKNHCVTEQSNKQKMSAMNFFNQSITTSPYITNLIWFVGATKKEVQNLLDVGDGKVMPSNILGNEFEFREMMQLLVWQKKPYKTKFGYRFDSNYGNSTIETITGALQLFYRVKEGMGDLTRKRIEQITMHNLGDKNILNSENTVSIYRGRAGTGKTVGLIQTAIRLADENQSRVLILTYNKALVGDIRRLFALADLPDMFEESCVQIATIQSYFFNLLNLGLFDGKLDGEKFLNQYDNLMKEFLALIKDDKCGREYLNEIKQNNYSLDWEYLLIDEAQDCTNIEKDLILSIFDKGHVLVADGGQQFVRNIDACNWSLIRERKNIKLKYCLRQKSNIINFLNVFIGKYGGFENKILSCDKIVGGKVIIITGDYLKSGIHQSEADNLKMAGNANYDMLYLVPSKMVEHINEEFRFRDITLFEKNGIFVWDGTNEKNRNSYSTDLEKIRLYQYESSRGLEGWTIVCLDFDEFLNIKERQYNPEIDKDALLLESAEEKKQKYLLNWALIPLTRAIDTLVIVLKDKDSKIGKVLREVASTCEDYVTWM